MSRFLLFLTVVVITLISVFGWGGEQCKDREQPFQLFSLEDNGIVLKKEALKLLRSKYANMHVKVLAVFGPARSGKSFFLNMITCNNTFAVGHDQGGKTHGGWALPIIDSDGSLVLLIDTEGLQRHAQEMEEYIVRFCVLGSSHMVYHMYRTIDEPLVGRFDDITLLYDCLTEKNVIDRVELPKTSWVVESGDNLNVPSKKELEDLLNEFKKEADFTRKKTINRIQKEWNEEEPFFIPSPIDAKSAEDYKSLPFRPMEELKKDYRTKMEEVKKRLEKISYKRLVSESDPMSGSEYADYLEAIVNMVNSPNVKLGNRFDALQYMNYIIQQAVNAAVNDYERCMSKLSLPMNEKDWSKSEEKCVDGSKKVFHGNCLSAEVNGGLMKDGLRDHDLILSKKKEFFNFKNINASRCHCERKIGEFKSEVISMKNKQTPEPGTDEFKLAVKDITKRYKDAFVGTYAQIEECRKELEKVSTYIIDWGDLPGDDSDSWFLVLASVGTIIAIVGGTYAILRFIRRGRNPVVADLRDSQAR